MGKQKRVRQERKQSVLDSAMWQDIRDIIVNCNGMVQVASASTVRLVRHHRETASGKLTGEMSQRVIAVQRSLTEVQNNLQSLALRLPRTNDPVTEDTYPHFLACMDEADNIFNHLATEITPSVTQITVELCPSEEDIKNAG